MNSIAWLKQQDLFSFAALQPYQVSLVVYIIYVVHPHSYEPKRVWEQLYLLSNFQIVYSLLQLGNNADNIKSIEAGLHFELQ